MHENWRSEKTALFLFAHDENEFPSCISYNSFLLTSFILSHHMVGGDLFPPPWKERFLLREWNPIDPVRNLNIFLLYVEMGGGEVVFRY